VVNRRRPSGFISTQTAADGQTEIHIDQNGGSRGSPRKAPAATAPKTIVATSNTSATPTILAARRETQRWRLLSLEPSSMRSADRFHSDSHVSAHGDHLAATLDRLGLSAREHGSNADQINARIAARLSEFVPVTSVAVVKDDVRQLLTLEVTETSGVVLPARSLSDAPLEFLSLTILREDYDAEGLLAWRNPRTASIPRRWAHGRCPDSPTRRSAGDLPARAARGRYRPSGAPGPYEAAGKSAGTAGVRFTHRLLSF
jgi:hypothetical protein